MKKIISVFVIISMLMMPVFINAQNIGWTSLGDGGLTVSKNGEEYVFDGKTASYVTYSTSIIPDDIEFELVFDKIPAYTDGAIDGKVHNTGAFVSVTFTDQIDLSEYSTREKWNGISLLMYLKNKDMLSVEVISNTIDKQWYSLFKKDVVADVVDGGTIKFVSAAEGIYINDVLIATYDSVPMELNGGAYLQLGSNVTAYYADIGFTLKKFKYQASDNNPKSVPLFNDGYKTDTAVNLMYRLGIMGLYDDGTFRADNTVTRAEFANILLNVLRIEPYGDGNVVFTDVTGKHPYFNAVNTGYALGLYIGTDNHEFAPDRAITYGEAMKMVVNLIGCEAFAQQNGGYPIGYMTVANERDISISDSFSFDTLLNRGLAAQLVYNAMNAPYLKLSGKFNSESVYESDANRTIMRDIYKVYKTRGVMEANADVTLSDITAGRNNVVVAGKVYEITDAQFGENVGYDVDLFYYAENNEVVYLEKTDKNYCLTVAAKNIVDATLGSSVVFKYYDDNRIVTENLLSGLDVIKNNKRLGSTEAISALNAKNGYVTFVDNNRDSVFDLAIVDSFDTVVIDQISYGSLKITDLLTKKEYVMQDNSYNIYRDGKKIGIYSLKSGDVIDIYEGSYNGKPYFDIYVSEGFEGNVTEIYDDVVILNGKEYSLSKSFLDYFNDEPKLNCIAMFFKDCDGNISYVSYELVNNSVYAYVCDLGYSQGIDSNIEIKLYNNYGNMILTKLANLVKVDDIKKSASDLYSSKSLDSIKNQVIEYRLNSLGELVEINTAKLINEADKFGISYQNPSAYYRVNASFESDVYIDQDTQFIVIPKDKEYDEYYSVFRGWGSLAINNPYNVKCYLKDEYNVAKLMLLEQPNNASMNLIHDNLFVLDKIGTALHNNEEVITISGTISGKYESYIIKEPILVEGLKQGDVFNVKVTTDGVVHETIGMFAAENVALGTKSNVEYVHSIWTRVYGNVVKINERNKKIVVDDGKERTYDLTPGYLPITVVDTSRKMVRTGTVRDIEAGQYIFMVIKESAVYNLVVYQ